VQPETPLHVVELVWEEHAVGVPVQRSLLMS
jgi:hypothetical protein